MQKTNNCISYINKLAVIIIAATVIYSTIEIYLQTVTALNVSYNNNSLNCVVTENTILSLLLCLLNSALVAKMHTQINVISTYQYKKDDVCSYIEEYCYRLALLGTVLVIIAPIWSQESIIVPYIPIVNNILFILGISCFGTFMLLYHITTARHSIINISFSIVTLVLFISLYYSYHDLKLVIEKYPVDLQFFYTTLFWSSNHIMNIIFTNALLIAWIRLLKLLNSNDNITLIYKIMILCNTAIAATSLLGHYRYRSESSVFQQFYINYTQNFVLLAPTILSITQLYYLLNTKSRHKISAQYNIIYYGLVLGPSLFLAVNIIGICSANLCRIAMHGTILTTIITFMTISYGIRSQQQGINSNFAIIQLFTHTIIYLLSTIITVILVNNYFSVETTKIITVLLYIVKLLELISQIMFLYITLWFSHISCAAVRVFCKR